MTHVERDLGFATADAQNVRIAFEEGALCLSFVDWRDQPREVRFDEVLAFRWQELDDPAIRDDTTYEIVDSPWLAQQAKLQAVDAARFAHYQLCFNACGVLDIVCHRR